MSVVSFVYFILSTELYTYYVCDWNQFLLFCYIVQSILLRHQSPDGLYPLSNIFTSTLQFERNYNIILQIFILIVSFVYVKNITIKKHKNLRSIRLNTSLKLFILVSLYQLECLPGIVQKQMIFKLVLWVSKVYEQLNINLYE